MLEIAVAGRGGDRLTVRYQTQLGAVVAGEGDVVVTLFVDINMLLGGAELGRAVAGYLQSCGPHIVRYWPI